MLISVFKTCSFPWLLLLCSIFHFSVSFRVDSNPYHHKEILDSRSKYTLEWTVDKESKSITFNVSVKTTGWVGFGLSKDGRMNNADIFVAGVDDKGNSYHFDMHVTKDRSLKIDAKQDWKLLSAKEHDGCTILGFCRSFDTCDDDDCPITSDHVALIWAYGEKDELGNHYHNRGAFSAYLLDPSMNPDIDSLVKQRNQPSYSVSNGPVQQWKVKRRYRLPNRRTTYWCSIHAGPKLPHKHHIIGYRTYLENEVARLHTHHLLVYRCKAPEGIDPQTLFEPFTKYEGEECYLNENRRLPLNLCRDPVSVWGYGGKPFFLPESVGFPIGENHNEYFLYESHHDNPDLRSDLEFETGVEYFITPKTRKRDGGVLIFGFDIPGSLALIPPGSPNFNLVGHCNSNCTRTMAPEKGIDVVAVGLHSHNAGRKARLRQFRNKQELPWVLNDDNYNPGFQQMRLLSEERKIMPGDHIVAQCVFDNTFANGTTTVTGFGTPDEMCIAFAVTANRIPYYRCTSEYPANKLLSTLGIHNVTWDLQRQQRVVVSPDYLKGLTIGQVSDYHVHWTEDMREDLEKDLKYSPHIVTCPSSAPPSAQSFLSSLSPESGENVALAQGSDLQKNVKKGVSHLMEGSKRIRKARAHAEAELQQEISEEEHGGAQSQEETDGGRSREGAEGGHTRDVARKKHSREGAKSEHSREETEEENSHEEADGDHSREGFGWGSDPTSEGTPTLPQGTPATGVSGLGMPPNVVFPKNAALYSPRSACKRPSQEIEEINRILRPKLVRASHYDVDDADKILIAI